MFYNEAEILFSMAEISCCALAATCEGGGDASNATHIRRF
jgi:hypothetical protein